MNKSKRRILGACAVFLCSGLTGLQASSAEQAEVWAQDLRQLRVPGKVGAVLWTVREDQCTLQVVFLNAGRLMAFQAEQPGGRPLAPATAPRPQVEAWLLKADGSVIAPDKSQPVGQAGPRTPHGIEQLFTFPLTVQREAVAVAIRIDGEQRVEKLAARVDATQ